MITSGSVCAAWAGWTNVSAAAAPIECMAFMTTSLVAGARCPTEGTIIRNCHSAAADVARLTRASLRSVCSSAVPNRNGTPDDKVAVHQATRESHLWTALSADAATNSLDCAPAPCPEARLRECAKRIQSQPCFRDSAQLESLRRGHGAFLTAAPLRGSIQRTAPLASPVQQSTRSDGTRPPITPDDDKARSPGLRCGARPLADLSQRMARQAARRFAD